MFVVDSQRNVPTDNDNTYAKTPETQKQFSRRLFLVFLHSHFHSGSSPSPSRANPMASHRRNNFNLNFLASQMVRCCDGKLTHLGSLNYVMRTKRIRLAARTHTKIENFIKLLHFSGEKKMIFQYKRTRANDYIAIENMASM